MKANYPVEFLAASMTLDMGNTDKLSEFRAEAKRLGVQVEPPSINRCGVAFEVEAGTIHYALAALKGVGRQAVEEIVEARGSQPFRDLAEFARRINPRAVNKRVLESLAAAGAFDALEENRAKVFAGVEAMLAASQREHDALSSGALEFSFGGSRDAQDPLRLPAVEAWLPAERLQKEFDSIGFFLTGHPLDDYVDALKHMRVQSWAEFARAVRAGASSGRVAATVVTRTERRTRQGSKMGIMGLSDPTGQYEAVIFSEGLQQFRDVLEPGAAVLLTLSAELQGDDVRARIQVAEPLDQAAAKLSKGLRIFLRGEGPVESVAKRLETPGGERAARERGDGEIALILMLGEGTEVEVKLPGRFKLSPQIAGAIKAVPGVVAVEAVS
jgi:DNA polymerase-3 subunit alpha